MEHNVLLPTLFLAVFMLPDHPIDYVCHLLQVDGKPLQQGINDPSSQSNHLVFGANPADSAEQQVGEL